MVGEGGCGNIHLFILTSGSGLSWFPQLPFSNVRLVVLVCFLIQLRLRNSERLGFPISVVLDEGRPTSLMKLRVGCRGVFASAFCSLLADVVHRKKVTAGGFDGWGWREFKVLPVSWFDGLARILSCVEDFGIWPEGLLDAYIAMIPKVDGDATPLEQRSLSVLPVVYRIWASAKMGQLEDWFRSWVPDSVFGAGGGGRSSVEAWYTTALYIEEVLSGVVDSDVHLFCCSMLLSPLIRSIGVFWMYFLTARGGACGVALCCSCCGSGLWMERVTLVGGACRGHMDVAMFNSCVVHGEDKLRSVYTKGLEKQSLSVRVLVWGWATTRRFDASWG